MTTVYLFATPPAPRHKNKRKLSFVVVAAADVVVIAVVVVVVVTFARAFRHDDGMICLVWQRPS